MKHIQKANVQPNFKKKQVNRKRRQIFAPYLFIMPFFILFLVFGAFPIAYSFFLSFFSWNGIKEMTPVGISNYRFILFGDYLFWKSLGNTIIMLVLSGIPQHLVALAFAFILHQGLVKLKEFFKGVLFVPYITSTAAVTVVFSMIFGIQYGFINMFFAEMNKYGILNLFITLNIPIIFYQGPMFWVSLSFIVFWKWVGWNAIIYLAGLQTIPDEIYEAARIDGANWLQIFLRITLPMLKPIIFFATSLTVIFGMQMFDEPVVWLGMDGILATGGYGMTSAVYMYYYAFKWSKFGVATASSYILCLIIVTLSQLYKKLFQEEK